MVKQQSSNAAPRKQGCAPMVVSSIAIFEMADMTSCHACAACVVFEKVLRRHRGGPFTKTCWLRMILPLPLLLA